VLSIEEEAGVQHLRDQRVRHLFGYHVQKVAGMIQVITGRNRLVTPPKLVIRGHDRGNLRDQSDGRPVLHLAIYHVSGRIEHAEGCAGGLQGVHRVPVLGETFDQITNLILDAPMLGHIGREPVEFSLGRKLIIERQVGNLQKGTVLGQLFDSNPAIFEQTGLVIHEADRGLGDRHPGQSRREFLPSGTVHHSVTSFDEPCLLLPV